MRHYNSGAGFAPIPCASFRENWGHRPVDEQADGSPSVDSLLRTGARKNTGFRRGWHDPVTYTDASRWLGVSVGLLRSMGVEPVDRSRRSWFQIGQFKAALKQRGIAYTDSVENPGEYE